MWIKTTQGATSRFYDAELMDAPVEFSENGTAQVPKDVGEELVARYDAIEHHETTTDSDSDADDSDSDTEE